MYGLNKYTILSDSLMSFTSHPCRLDNVYHKQYVTYTKRMIVLDIRQTNWSSASINDPKSLNQFFSRVIC